MPLPTTPRRPRTSSLKLSHTKTTPVLLSPFPDCKTPIPPVHPVSKSCTCTTTRKRRCLPAGSRSYRRPRRQDCPLGLNSHGPSAFDRLPWVSILNAPASQTNPWDVADLSQLPIDERPLSLGPIRHRKTSSRSVPFPPTPSSSPPYSFIPFPSLKYASRDPRTPPREIEPPSAILFQGLLPAPV